MNDLILDVFSIIFIVLLTIGIIFAIRVIIKQDWPDSGFIPNPKGKSAVFFGSIFLICCTLLLVDFVLRTFFTLSLFP